MNVKTAAVQTLKTQLSFLNYYKSREGKLAIVSFVSSLVEKDYLSGPIDDTDVNEYVAQSGLRVAQEMAEALGVGQTFYMTDEMMDLNLQAASQIPSINMTLEDLPADQGFLLLPRPVTTIDVRQDRMSVRAFAWWKSEVRMATPGQPVFKVPAMMLAAYSNKADVDVDDAMLKLRDEDPKLWLRWPQWQLAHWCPMYFHNAWGEIEDRPGKIQVKLGEHRDRDDDKPEEELEDAPQDESIYAFVRSFFLLVRQKIAVIHTQHPGRSAAHRIQSAGLPPSYGEIQVVTLRKERPTSPDEVGDGTPMNWSHRWIVSGHWRKQWYPSLGRHEPIWINNFIKGPEDKPLIVKDKVFVWKR